MGPSSKEGGGTKPSGGSGGMKTASFSSSGLKFSKKEVSISEDLALNVVVVA